MKINESYKKKKNTKSGKCSCTWLICICTVKRRSNSKAALTLVLEYELEKNTLLSRSQRLVVMRDGRQRGAAVPRVQHLKSIFYVQMHSLSQAPEWTCWGRQIILQWRHMENCNGCQGPSQQANLNFALIIFNAAYFSDSSNMSWTKTGLETKCALPLPTQPQSGVRAWEWISKCNHCWQ